eukprot:TRINITY_DN93673_c0_g1_i1.p2 TRINITY_DN93673_c0_g1~~TRINITY_DN93673_c0_g1_i1.p2  ORF type:complete len:106 (+),score=22.86 TRINITY_DN93673_c0_g1_i1:101-418(+)
MAAAPATANTASWNRQTSDPSPWERTHSQGSQDPFHCGTSEEKKCDGEEAKKPAAAVHKNNDKTPTEKIYRANVVDEATEDFNRQISQEPFHCPSTGETRAASKK